MSLSVEPDGRGQGIGGRLLDTVDDELEAAGITDLMVGVLAGNEDALRFYTRRGLATGELIMWRFGGRP